MKTRAQVTFSANKSLSKLCPINMVSALNMFSRTAWTSRRVMLVFSRSSSVTPENLQSNRTQVGILHLKAQSPSALREWWAVEFQQCSQPCHVPERAQSSVPRKSILSCCHSPHLVSQPPSGVTAIPWCHSPLLGVTALTWCCNPPPWSLA